MRSGSFRIKKGGRGNTAGSVSRTVHVTQHNAYEMFILHHLGLELAHRDHVEAPAEIGKSELAAHVRINEGPSYHIYLKLLN